MTGELFFEIHRDLPRQGPGRDPYTRRAFKMLPALERPRILDMGCGPGRQTLELARQSGGEVIGLDNHRPYLDQLREKIEAAGLTERVHAVEGSMFALEFADESFDVIWAEGSIYIMGFEKALTEWRRLVVPGGFVVASEVSWLKPHPPKEILAFWQEAYPAITVPNECLKRIEACGYTPLGHFALPDDAWWIEYYNPLQERLVMLRQKYGDNQEMLALLAEEQREIDLYRKYSKSYGYVFYLMQKPGEAGSA